MSQSPTVNPNDPALLSGTVQYPGDGATVTAYRSRPKAEGRYPAVIVIHENQGLVEHIQDVARRFAKAGFLAIAPDFLSRRGGTKSFPNREAAIEGIKTLKNEEVQSDLQATLSYLKQSSEARADRIGVVGFCWGGAQSLLFSTQTKGLSAAVVFYGRNPSPLDLVQNITAPLLGIYGEDDPNIMPGVPALEEALKKSGKTYEIKIYPKAKHAFHNDTNPERYHPDAAKDAWERTVNFYTKHLKA